MLEKASANKTKTIYKQQNKAKQSKNPHNKTQDNKATPHPPYTHTHMPEKEAGKKLKLLLSLGENISL